MRVQAQRLLLRSALQDPLNQRFVFLSEACAPLIPATTMYAQLMSEPKSRIKCLQQARLGPQPRQVSCDLLLALPQSFLNQ